LIIRCFPDKAITKKPAETRMGKGKGNVEGWVFVARRRCMLFELKGVDEARAREIMRPAQYKLPMKTRFIKQGDSVDVV
jgi:large subunit ribosomal protein L16